MNELKVLGFHGMQVVDSREVAKLVEKQHKNLLRDIDGYIETMRNFTELKIEPSDFFIKSTYKDSTGRTLPCYLLTKKGCDMVANKMIGDKGVLFTATYITAFEKMRHMLAVTPIRPEGVSLSGLAKLISVTRRVMLDAGSSPYDVCGMVKETFNAVGFPVPSTFPKQVPGQISLFEHTAKEVIEHG